MTCLNIMVINTSCVFYLNAIVLRQICSPNFILEKPDVIWVCVCVWVTWVCGHVIRTRKTSNQTCAQGQYSDAFSFIHNLFTALWFCSLFYRAVEPLQNSTIILPCALIWVLHPLIYNLFYTWSCYRFRERIFLAILYALIFSSCRTFLSCHLFLSPKWLILLPWPIWTTFLKNKTIYINTFCLWSFLSVYTKAVFVLLQNTCFLCIRTQVVILIYDRHS